MREDPPRNAPRRPHSCSDSSSTGGHRCIGVASVCALMCVYTCTQYRCTYHMVCVSHTCAYATSSCTHAHACMHVCLHVHAHPHTCIHSYSHAHTCAHMHTIHVRVVDAYVQTRYDDKHHVYLVPLTLPGFPHASLTSTATARRQLVLGERQRPRRPEEAGGRPAEQRSAGCPPNRQMQLERKRRRSHVRTPRAIVRSDSIPGNGKLSDEHQADA